MADADARVGIRFRAACLEDVEAIVDLLASDALGAKREDPARPLGEGYLDAFRAVDADPNQLLLVGLLEDEVVAVLQLTFIPSLTYQGSWRAQMEGVRVASSVRGQGIGELLVSDAIDRARARGCRMVQLTSDRQRPRAIAFYERLGFVGTHVGMKLHLR